MTDFNLSAERMFRAMPLTTATTRIFLAGALIEPIEGGGAWIVATDGHAMLIQRDRDAVAPQRAIIRVVAPEVTVDPDDDEATTPLGWHWCGARITIPAAVTERTVAAPVHWTRDAPGAHVIAESTASADKFPDWRRVIGTDRNRKRDRHIPDLPDSRFTGLGTGMLRPLIEWTHNIRLHPAPPGQAMSITYDNDPDSLGVIMPRAVAADSGARLAALMRDIGIEEPKQ